MKWDLEGALWPLWLILIIIATFSIGVTLLILLTIVHYFKTSAGKSTGTIKANTLYIDIKSISCWDDMGSDYLPRYTVKLYIYWIRTKK